MPTIKTLLIDKVEHHHIEASQERKRREGAGMYLTHAFGLLSALHDLAATIALAALSGYEREGEDIRSELEVRRREAAQFD